VVCEAGRLFWFLDGRFIGQSLPETPFFWKAVPGTYHVRCVDENGRSDETVMHVISVD
jgi:penicillin-binding protein 1C